MTTSVDLRTTLLRIGWWLFVASAAVAAGWLVTEAWWHVQTLPNRGWDFQTARIMGALLLNLFFAAALAVMAALYFWGRMATSLPDLQGWHLQRPESEFHASDAIAGYTFDDYLEQERRVFQELDALV